MELKDGNGKVIAKVTGADCNSPGCDEGVWIELQADDGTRPTLCMVKAKPGDYMDGQWYLGVYRDATKPNASGCDLAITFDKKAGPLIQVTMGDQVLIRSLYDLLNAHNNVV